MLITTVRNESGSAPVESAFAIVILMLLALSVIQLGLTLYGRNVILGAAHEGARAAVELGRDTSEARALARSTIERGAGSIVNDLQVVTSAARVKDRYVVRVEVAATLDVLGPLPVSIPVRTSAMSARRLRVE